MSEYQHYEWHRAGRRLSSKEKVEVGKLSSHIEVNEDSAWVEYEWGDFKHNPIEMLGKYFDLFVYDSNWGSQQVAMRWDAGLVDFKALQRFALNEVIVVSQKNGSVFFDACFNENDQDALWNDGDDGEGNLFAAFTAFLPEIQKGDERALYLLWLKGVELEGTDNSQIEPPPGLGSLTREQKKLIRFIGLDDEVLAGLQEKSAPLRGARGKKSGGVVKKRDHKTISAPKRKSTPDQKPSKDPEREDRIIMEAVVDAYGEGERAIGWYCHLENKIQFPFKARIRKTRGTNPLNAETVVTVLELADSEDCAREIFVRIAVKKGGEEYGIPLDQIEPLPSTDKESAEAVLDWHYWMDQGYMF